jgi:hypothetical protein
MRKQIFIIPAILVILIMACSTTTLKPAPAVTNSAGATILYQNSLADPKGGWAAHQTTNSTMDYAYGGYHINVTSPDILAFVTAGQSFQSDVIVEVDSTKTSGPDDNYLGVICRYQDTDNFYFFVISSDGFGGIAMYKANQMSILSGTAFVASPAINQGAATNHLRAECQGTSLTLSVNGKQVASTTDSTFTTGGDSGVLARANTVAGVDILFKNFVVSKP